MIHKTSIDSSEIIMTTQNTSVLFATKKVPLTAKAQVPARTIEDLDKEYLKSLRKKIHRRQRGLQRHRRHRGFRHPGTIREGFHSCADTIPGIRVANIFGKDIDPSDKDVLCRRNHTSAAPPGPSSNASAESSSFADSVKSNTVVLSKTRISFEAPIDLEDLTFDEEETGKAARLKRRRWRHLISSTPSEKTKKLMNMIFLMP